MPRKIGFCCVAAACFWTIGSAAALAQQWAEDMFPTKSHDFGALARGAKAEYTFLLKNPYNEDARIKTVRTSCGCAGVKYPTESIKTYDTKQIVVAVDTRAFLGRKDTTLTVEFDQPFPAEVVLKIHCYIRKDVVFQPGAIQFGSVKQGEGARRSTTVSYAGRDDWRITTVESPNPFIHTTLTETRRGMGRVTYELAVELKPDAPAGYLSGQLVLKTNDASTQASQVPLPIEGVVESDLSVRPASLTFLATHGEQSMTRNVVVQGAQPFRVTDIRCDDPRFRWKLPTKTAKFHVLPITFAPGGAMGNVNARLEIQTDAAGGRGAAIDMHAEIAAPAAERS